MGDKSEKTNDTGKAVVEIAAGPPIMLKIDDAVVEVTTEQAKEMGVRLIELSAQLTFIAHIEAQHAVTRMLEGSKKGEA